MLTDAELLGAYADTRSEMAFAELVERRIGFVYGAALRQTGGDAHVAQDVAQAVFTLVAKKAATLAHHESLAGWLCTTTTHMARRALRDAQGRRKREQEAAIMNETETAEVTDIDKLKPLLDDALNGLREGDREAVLLRFFEGCGFAEIGARLRMSEDAARMRVARAVEKMRGTLAKRGVTSSAAALVAMMTAEVATSVPVGLAASVSAGAMATTAVTSVVITSTSAFCFFMSSAKMTGVAAAALLIAGCGVFYSWQRECAAADALTEAARENRALLARLQATDVPSRQVQAVENPLDAGKRFLADHPEIKAKLVTYKRAIGLSKIFSAIRGLDLPEEKIEQLAIQAGANGYLEGSVGYSTPSLSGALTISGYGKVSILDRKAPDTPEEAAVIAILGKEDAERFWEAWRENRTFPYQYDLVRDLYFSDAPLSVDQLRQMRDVHGKVF